MKYRFLSHIMTSPLPVYGGQDSIMIDPVKSLQSGLRELWVLPLRVEKIDSAPCTVIGGFDDYKCDSPGDTRFILFETG